MLVKSLQACPALCDPVTVTRQAVLAMGFSSKNTGVGCHAVPQVIFSTLGSNASLLFLLHWQAGSLPLTTSEKRRNCE